MEQYARGYFVCTPSIETPASVADWEQVSLGQFRMGIHSRTPWHCVQGNDVQQWVAFVGHVVDTQATRDSGAKIASRASATLERSGIDAVIRDVAYLSGRFIALIVQGDELTVIPDCHATLAAYTTHSEHGFVVSSHAAMAAEFTNASADEVARTILQSPEYTDAGGRYYPGTRTPYAGVSQVFANCLARYDVGSKRYEHQRFYPWDEITPAVSPEDAYDEFVDELERTVVALDLVGTANISLTSGLDSATILTASQGRVSSDAYAYTYFRFETPAESTIADLLGASERARAAGMPHHIMRLRPYDSTQPWVSDYTKTFPKGARFPALARAYAESFRHDEISWISTVAETGTVFYTERETLSITPERLAEKYSYSKTGRNATVIELMSEYIDYTGFNDSNVANLDYHDLFYWEHRNTKWAALWYSEADLSHTAIAPFNNRRLIEIMLSLPLELRRDRYLMERYASQLLPEIYGNVGAARI